MPGSPEHPFSYFNRRKPAMPDQNCPEPCKQNDKPSKAQKSDNPKRPISEARLAANRANAKKSTGPRTKEGKQRSSLNATRHGILAQVIHLPKEDMAAYNKFTADYVASLAPLGTVEIQLAHACADIQFRLHRMAAAEHNLFALGHEENGDNWNTGHPESHAAFTFADTLRRSKDPIATITLYEQRLSRRLLQTLKQLRRSKLSAASSKSNSSIRCTPSRPSIRAKYQSWNRPSLASFVQNAIGTST
jgi:hypothetical protein